MQLAAGSEHIINGRTVRINLAGPRPDQQQQQTMLQQPPGSLQAGFPGMMPWQPPQPAYTALPTASAYGGMPLACRHLFKNVHSSVAALSHPEWQVRRSETRGQKLSLHALPLCRASWDGFRGR